MQHKPSPNTSLPQGFLLQKPLPNISSPPSPAQGPLYQPKRPCHLQTPLPTDSLPNVSSTPSPHSLCPKSCHSDLQATAVQGGLPTGVPSRFSTDHLGPGLASTLPNQPSQATLQPKPVNHNVPTEFLDSNLANSLGHQAPTNRPPPLPSQVPTSDSTAELQASLSAACLQNSARYGSQARHVGPRACLANWVALGVGPKVLKAIASGVRWPISGKPAPESKPTPAHLVQHLAPTVQQYLDQGAVRPLTVEETLRTKYWVPLLGKEKPQGGWRLITALCGVNRHLDTPSFKADTWQTVTDLLANPELHYAVKLDVKDAFFHYGLHPSAGRWARFRLNGVGYQFLEMPFGIQSGPYWCQQMFSQVLAHLRNLGFFLCWVVDDVLVLGRSPQHCLQQALYIVQLLTALGVLPNLKKCALEPVRQIEFYGMNLNLQSRLVTAPPAKIQQWTRIVKKALKGRTAVPRFVAKVAGGLLDLCKGVLNLVGLPKILMHWVGKHVQLRSHWDKAFQKENLQENLLKCLQALQHPIPQMHLPHTTARFAITSDSSDLGWGAWLGRGVSSVPIAVTQQIWSCQEMPWHSTLKETAASTRSALALATHTPAQVILEMKSDCSTTVYAWQNGSSKPHINEPVRLARSALASMGIQVQALHVSGIHNQLADTLSRDIKDPHNYMLNPRVFQAICRHYKVQPQIDLFAGDDNRQVELFYSYRLSSQAVATNAFSQDWGAWEVCWANPPWPYIPRFLNQVQRQRALVLAVLPVWRTAPWWPLMLSLCQQKTLTLHGPLYCTKEKEPLPAPRWKSIAVLLGG